MTKAVAMLGLLTLSLQPSAVPASRTVYVSVVGKNNAPVRGLTAADFTVKEDGQAVAVQAVDSATRPLHVAFCGDWYGYPGDEQPLEPFIADVLSKHLFSQFELPNSPQWIGNSSQLHAVIASGIALRGAHDSLSSSSSLLQIVRTAKALDDTELSRPVIVAFFDMQRSEFDAIETGRSLQINSLNESTILDALGESHASLWVLVRGANGALEFAGQRLDPRRSVYQDATTRSGGLWLDAGLNAKGATKAMLQIADLLDAQYAITFVPAAGDQGNLQVTTSKPNVRVLSPSK